MSKFIRYPFLKSSSALISQFICKIRNQKKNMKHKELYTMKLRQKKTIIILKLLNMMFLRIFNDIRKCSKYNVRWKKKKQQYTFSTTHTYKKKTILTQKPQEPKVIHLKSQWILVIFDNLSCIITTSFLISQLKLQDEA